MKTAILGEEYDIDLKFWLIDRLKSFGATPVASNWSVVGSQELDSLSVQIKGHVLDIESETFVGLSVRGPDEWIDQIVEALSAWKRPDSSEDRERL